MKEQNKVLLTCHNFLVIAEKTKGNSQKGMARHESIAAKK